MEASLAGTALVATVPNIRVDGNSFDWYLARNDINVQRDGDTVLFESTNDRERATVIWKTLTGCGYLGLINSWKKWEEYL